MTGLKFVFTSMCGLPITARCPRGWPAILHFNVSGGGLDPLLTPELMSPASALLEAGEEETTAFSTDGTDGPEGDCTAALAFRDARLVGPVEPNRVQGVCTGSVKNSSRAGCFIATATHGSYLDRQVESLRRLRGGTLTHSRPALSAIQRRTAICDGMREASCDSVRWR